jgi:hypothetical protein
MQKVVEINKHKFFKYLFSTLLFSIIQLHKFKTEMIGTLIENRNKMVAEIWEGGYCRKVTTLRMRMREVNGSTAERDQHKILRKVHRTSRKDHTETTVTGQLKQWN